MTVTFKVDIQGGVPPRMDLFTEELSGLEK